MKLQISELLIWAKRPAAWHQQFYSKLSDGYPIIVLAVDNHEIGKIPGLDRVAEVRCLRRKMDELSAANAAERWAAHLGRHWMQADAEAVGALYIDGHV